MAKGGGPAKGATSSAQPPRVKGLAKSLAKGRREKRDPKPAFYLNSFAYGQNPSHPLAPALTGPDRTSTERAPPPPPAIVDAEVVPVTPPAVAAAVIDRLTQRVESLERQISIVQSEFQVFKESVEAGFDDDGRPRQPLTSTAVAHALLGGDDPPPAYEPSFHAAPARPRSRPRTVLSVAIFLVAAIAPTSLA